MLDGITAALGGDVESSLYLVNLMECRPFRKNCIEGGKSPARINLGNKSICFIGITQKPQGLVSFWPASTFSFNFVSL